MNPTFFPIPPRVKVEKGSQIVTGNAGGILVRGLAVAMGLHRLIDEKVRVKVRERGYGEAEMILSLCENLALGGECLDDLDGPRHDDALLRLLGVANLPDPTTAGRFLRRFTVGHLKQLDVVHREALVRAHRLSPTKTATLFGDSSIFPAYGAAKEGVEPTWKGGTGYHPLLCFIEETEELVHSRLRRGGAYTARGAVGFLEEAIRMVPSTVEALGVRLDAGFFDEEVCEALERSIRGPLPYSISAEQNEPLRAHLRALATVPGMWRAVPGTEIEVAEMIYRPPTWKRPRRFLAWKEPYLTGEQLRLDDGPDHRLRVLVTVASAPAEEIVAAHRKAFDGENRIKSLKHGAGLSHIPPGDFDAAAAYFSIGQLAYNLMVWLKRLALPEAYLLSALKKVRDRFLRVAGIVVVHARQLRLRLSAGYRFAGDFIAAYDRILAIESG